MPQAGFCFLAMTKTGSTAIERTFQRHAQIAVRRPPRMKHMTARSFDRLLAPVLEHYGHPREDYELLCVVREPVAWVHSWWRYRQRPGVEAHTASTAGLSFPAFAAQVVAGEVVLGSSSSFVRVAEGRPPVERVYRYDHLADAVAWMAGRLGVDVPEVPRVNESPAAQEQVVDRATRSALQAFYADDAALYERAR